MVQKKKRTKRDRFLLHRNSPHPEELLQQKPITRKTTFLWVEFHDETGAKAYWVWSDSPRELIDFLFEVPAFKTLVLNEETVALEKKEKLLKYEELAGAVFATSLFQRDQSTLQRYALAMTAPDTLRDAVKSKADLNSESAPFLGMFSNLFYPLYWQFYDYSSALDALHSHQKTVGASLPLSFKNDVGLPLA